MSAIRKLKQAAGLLFVLGVSSAANASLIQTALSIVIDGSGSISGSEFGVQRTAYATVLNDLVPTDGSVVLNVVQFASAGSTRVEQSAIRISDGTALATLLGSINTMTQINGSTAIGRGIELGYTDMDSYLSTLAATEFAPTFRKLIDVSTDGGENNGTDPAGKSANAVSSLGYDAVNCLGIGSNPSALCAWNDGFGDDFAALTFDQIEAALRTKITAEIINPPPPNLVSAPATLVLLGFGLLGLRRRASRAA